MPGSLDDSLAIAALVQCLVKALSDEIDEGTYQHDCHPMMVRQNKWRATRFGNKAELVDAFTHEVQPVPAVVESLIRVLSPIAAQLKCTTYLEHCQQMADKPSWANRQLSILETTADAREVVRILCDQSRTSGV
jgi:carboxylate-amine ligase